ncbi:MAG: hypothetical protein P8Y36_06415 [Alphaproteobacteria bacterium]
MTIVDGDNKGTTLTYKPTSTGGKRMIAKLAAEIARAYDDSDSFVPVVELYSSPYHNRRWNKRIFNPFADIIDWRTLEDSEFSRPGESGDTKTDAKKPAARKRGEKDAAPARGRKPARSRDAVDVDEDGNVMPNDDADEKPARGRGRPRKDDDAAPARGRGRSKTDKLYDDARESLRGRGREDAAEPEEEEEEEANEPARTRGRGRGREEANEPARSGPRGAGRARGRR